MLRVMLWQPERGWCWSKTAWRMRYQDVLRELGITFVSHAPDLLLVGQERPPRPFSDVPSVVEITMDAITIQPEMLSWITAPNVAACFRNVLYRYPRDYERDYVQRDVYGLRWSECSRGVPYVSHPSPALPWGLLDKIHLVLPLYTPPTDLAFQFTENYPPLAQRPWDVCFAGRMTYSEHGWPEQHRQCFAAEFEKLPCVKVFHDVQRQGSMPMDHYLQWMMRSKIAVSPWGWTAWNIRDYEALLCGCVLIKPECSGVRSIPDLYAPWEDLIVWCEPDFRDLRHAVARALDNLRYRQERVQYGRQLLEEHLRPRSLLVRWAQALHDVSGK